MFATAYQGCDTTTDVVLRGCMSGLAPSNIPRPFLWRPELPQMVTLGFAYMNAVSLGHCTSIVSAGMAKNSLDQGRAFLRKTQPCPMTPLTQAGVALIVIQL
jgi:hypothetical protein